MLRATLPPRSLADARDDTANGGALHSNDPDDDGRHVILLRLDPAERFDVAQHRVSNLLRRAVAFRDDAAEPIEAGRLATGVRRFVDAVAVQYEQIAGGEGHDGLWDAAAEAGAERWCKQLDNEVSLLRIQVRFLPDRSAELQVIVVFSDPVVVRLIEMNAPSDRFVVEGLQLDLALFFDCRPSRRVIDIC